jgi:DNA ligase 1
MPDLQEGQVVEIQGSAAKPYLLKNVAGVYSCTCPAWRNQSLSIDRRTCKHLRQFRGVDAERQRLGELSLPAAKQASSHSKPTPPALLLAETWTPDANIKGWWHSEKLDGVRAYWDGQRFLSRRGNQFYAPAWFIEKLPQVPLDGELWLARKSFQRTVSIVRRQDAGDLWRSVQFVVFDAPSCEGVFETRLAHIRDCFASQKPQFAQVLDQQRCRNSSQLERELARVLALGGEGLMLRQPHSLYEPRRSQTLLKVKQFQDAEARVIGHQPGTGRHKRRLGALLVILSDGTEFAVGTGFTDARRESPHRSEARSRFGIKN